MAVDIAALALRIEAIGLKEANIALDQLETTGRKAGATFTGFEQKTGTLGSGMKKLQGVMSAAVISAAGLDGTLGKVGKTMLNFGAGGWVGVAVVGLGILAAAFASGKKQADEFQKSVESAQKAALRGAPTGLSPLAQAGVISEQISNVRAKGGGLVGQIADKQVRPDLLDTLERTWAKELSELARLSGLERALRQQADEEHQESVTKAAVTRVTAEQDALELIRQSNAELDKMPVWRAPALMGLPGGSFTAAGGQLDSIAVRHAALGANVAREAEASAMRDTNTILDIRRAKLKEEEKAANLTSAAITGISQTVAQMIAVLSGGGGFWATLSALATGIGGVLAFTNPVTGAALVAGGTIVGALSSASAQSTAPASAANPARPVVVQQTIIGERDPVAQAAIARMTEAAVWRGYSLGGIGG